MKNLYIIGAGGCGREVLQWVKDINKISNCYNIMGFLDARPNCLDELRGEEKVVSSIEDYIIKDEDVFVCCIGNSQTRKKIVEQMEEKGAQFVSIIHPSANVADTAIIGKGVIVYPFALISDNAEIGDGTIINMYSSVAHDSRLGSYCTISAHCDITGMCTLGDDVFMGTTSHMVPGTVIGDNAYICAGSTVMGKVRGGRKVLGNPAKIVKL